MIFRTLVCALTLAILLLELLHPSSTFVRTGRTKRSFVEQANHKHPAPDQIDVNTQKRSAKAKIKQIAKAQSHSATPVMPNSFAPPEPTCAHLKQVSHKPTSHRPDTLYHPPNLA